MLPSNGWRRLSAGLSVSCWTVFLIVCYVAFKLSRQTVKAFVCRSFSVVLKCFWLRSLFLSVFLPTCVLCCAFVCVSACLSICPHGCPCVDVYRTEVTSLNHEQIALDYIQEIDDVTGLVNMSAFCIQDVSYICQVCFWSQRNPSWAPRTQKLRSDLLRILGHSVIFLLY